MKYSIDSPHAAQLMDMYVTGNYGEILNSKPKCCCCGSRIEQRERYYDINGIIYCMNCEEEAETTILNDVREDYIFMD